MMEKTEDRLQTCLQLSLSPFLSYLAFFQPSQKIGISSHLQIQHTIYAKIKKKGMQKKCQKKTSKQNLSA